MDHDRFVVFLQCFALVLNITFVLFFNTKMKRTQANREDSSHGQENLAITEEED